MAAVTTSPLRARTVRPMRARDTSERHRASTPLELLFDLTFVVAVSAAAQALAHGVEQDRPASALGSYLLVFFAIWWSWMNFTWFASAYDTDDAPYRLLTLVQMAGVLVLAAGVTPAFEHGDWTAITVGYVVMRVAMLSQWARSARSEPATRGAAVRYVLGTTVVQAAWLLRLLLPAGAGVASFLVLAAAELAVPVWAERRTGTPWHPHHIAERFGLFTLIVLGESVLAATTGVRAALADGGWSPQLLVVAGAGLVLLFALWWWYFLDSAGDGLARNPRRAYAWGYAHYLLFAGLAAIGGGLETAVAAVGHHGESPAWVVTALVAWPTGAVLALCWGMHDRLGSARPAPVGVVVAAVTLTVAVPALTRLGLPVPWSVPLIAVPPALLVALVVAAGPSPRPGTDDADDGPLRRPGTSAWTGRGTSR